MLKKTVTYENLDGVQVTEDFYFNMTKAELLKLSLSDDGKFAERAQAITKPGAPGSEIIALFEDTLRMSYGVRTADGKFVKSKEEFEAFLASEAYSNILFEIATDAQKSVEFLNAIMPAELVAEAQVELERQNTVQGQNVAPNISRLNAGFPENPDGMSDSELLDSLGVSNAIRTTNGLTDDEIWNLTGPELTKQPREVLLRAYQLKNQKSDK